ncbi:alpha/beta fold hydrolase [Neobacillus mesonae]|uniref:alpha/beta fold hydrolase n=1 Tax=Neobacillus mesonae TaxID=1193713 RepID=UPI00203EAB0C|nr:alpha/beta hydrolase [Neobacillus mesonae]MCM3569236.1 alpha/beta hydrolase [Neobacillus mesonae]
MNEFSEHIVHANGIDMHVAECGKGKPVLFLHGFPELWYSWRYQLPYLSKSGYRAIAVDLRGYGQSSVPDNVRSYSMRNMVEDIVQLVNEMNLDRAALVGHDWGANIAWACAQMYPERFDVVLALSVPFSPRPPMPLTEMIKKNSPSFNWLVYFQDEGVAESELEKDIETTLHRIYYGLSGDAPEGLPAKLVSQLPKESTLLDPIPDPPDLPTWLTKNDLNYFVDNFKQTGFTGALNRYRNVDYDWIDLEKESQRKIMQPALFIGGELDTATSFNKRSIEIMNHYVPNIKDKIIIPGAGHYVQQEASEDVNRIIVEFLDQFYI